MKIKINDKGLFFSSLFSVVGFIVFMFALHSLVYKAMLLFSTVSIIKKIALAFVLILTWELDKMIYQSIKKALK